MAIESQTPAAQLELLRRLRIAALATQRFAHRIDPITPEQGASINTALTALALAMTNAGVTS